MKNKWVVVLFVIFLGVIFFSLLITQQSQKDISLLEEKEAAITEQAESGLLSSYVPLQKKPASSARRILEKGGITVIKTPSVEPVENNTRVSKTADKTVKNVSIQNVAANSEEAVIPQTGITPAGKLPSPKETQEMNSSGIVMY